MSEYTREEILELIEENDGPEGLDLSGKDLSGMDLGRGEIAAELERVRKSGLHGTPPWFSDLTEGMNLSKACLQEAKLQEAILEGADLTGARLQGAGLHKAILEGADLTGAKLQGAVLTKAGLQKVCLLGANLERAVLLDTKLQEADLEYTRLQKAHFGCANLQGVKLRYAHLQGARLGDADLQGAHLAYCHLEKVDLFGAASLEGAYFYNVFLDDTRLKRKQLGEAIGEELAGEYDKAKEAYLALKNNFAEIGRYEDAAWAYCKERRMEKAQARQQGHWRKYITDQFVEWICDYGESVPRVLCSLLAVYVLFTLICGLTWSVIRVHTTPTAVIREPTRNLVDLARFSLGAMTTMDLTGLEPRNGLVELLAGLEALLGIALTGLLGFVAGNRIRRS